MKKFLLPWALVFLVLSTSAYAQDFSNKGRDFWIGYGNHVRMFNGGTGGAPYEKMQLYITSDVTTTGQVTIASVGFSQNFVVTANQITTIDIPRSAILADHGPYNHGIHVTAVEPVVVYSFIYVNAVSGATLCLPTNTLGKDYYSVNFTQTSNEPNCFSYFFVIATDTGTTNVEITPSAMTKAGQAPNIPFTVSLTQGQIYQVLGQTVNNSGVDLTGSRIRSISTSTGACKRIAVYSGSSKISIGCTNPSSSDNLYQQMYPTSAWGKKYITTPGLVNTNNFFRIAKSDPSANVSINGVLIPPGSFTNGFYHQFSTNLPKVIESDKPILVAQYFTTQGCSGNGNPGDPEMIFLNPIEQTIDKVTLNSMQPATGTALNQHYMNVVLKNSPAAISSFRIDGNPYTNFTAVPADPTYVYARIPTTAGTHTVTCDTGFNIIAYGFGPAESYGYSGGANIKDLYQFVSIQNQYATVDFPSICRTSPFYFSMTFPYQPTQIQWLFNGLFADVTINNPVADSTWMVNGRQLYKYKLPGAYTTTVAAGTYPIKVVAQNPTSDGCGNEQVITYDLQVFNKPTAAFTFTSDGCVSSAVQFTDAGNTNGRPATQWNWNFGDAGSGASNTSGLKNPTHLFSAPGTFQVQYSFLTDVGCVSDTAILPVTLVPPPVAKFGATAPFCIGLPVTFSDSSTSAASTLVKWYWDFGDGGTVVAATGANQQHTYSAAGTYNVTLQVETANGCKSTVFSLPVTVTGPPVSNFTFGNACLPGGAMQFTNSSTNPDGSTTGLVYNWNFGDGGLSTATNPVHNYTTVGPFDVKLTVSTAAGCTSNIIKSVNTIYAQPQALFMAPAEICFGTAAVLTDQSTAAGSTVTQWLWTFDDGTTSTAQNPNKNFATPGNHQVTLTVTSAIGCISATTSKNIFVNKRPTALFNVSSPNCVTRQITFTDQSTANDGSLIEWTWDMGDGTPLIKSTGAAFTHTYATTGPKNVTLVVTTNKDCSSVLYPTTVTVSPLPVPGFIMPENCISDPFSLFTDTSKIEDGTEAGFTYLWNFGDANANASNPNTSTVKNPQHKFTQSGNYNISLTVTSSNGCTSNINQQFVVNGDVPQASFSVQGGLQQCSNKDVVIINQSSVDFGTVGKVDIFWDYANAPSSKIVDPAPAPGKQYSNAYPEFFTPATKTYQVRMIAYSGDNCTDDTTITITVKATPEIQFDALPSACMDTAAFQITQASVLNGMTGGVFSGPGVNASGFFMPTAAGPGTHTIRYTVNAPNGCSNYKEQTITIFPVPTANAGPDKTVLEGGSGTLDGSGSGNNISFLWTPATWLNDNTDTVPVVTPLDDITYTLTVTSADGCRATDNVFIKMLKAPTVPNVFTPNGDGINDRWEIKYLETYPGATVDVYNSYGQLVFQSTNYLKPWDGSYKGKPLPVGTYYYIINPKNGRKQIAGYVDIVR